MIGVLVWLMLCALAIGIAVLPLWLRGMDAPLGRGSDSDEPEHEWQGEKDRLVSELRDLDRALAEGRIDAAIHARQRAALSGEADQALIRLRRARASVGARDASHTPRRYPAAAAAAIAVLIAASGGVVMLSARGDIVRGVSPHADGRVPIPAQQTTANAAPAASAESGTPMTTPAAPHPPMDGKTAAGAMPATADGAPDIGQMVQRLENRVREGNPTTQDLMMLGRSYRVLGRDTDAIGVLKQATERDATPATLFAYGEALFRGGGDVDEAAATFERVLAQAPRMPEALWYKSLTLVKRHRVDEARAILRDLRGLVTDNQEATRAVGELLATLDRVGPASTPRPQAN